MDTSARWSNDGMVLQHEQENGATAVIGIMVSEDWAQHMVSVLNAAPSGFEEAIRASRRDVLHAEYERASVKRALAAREEDIATVRLLNHDLGEQNRHWGQRLATVKRALNDSSLSPGERLGRAQKLLADWHE